MKEMFLLTCMTLWAGMTSGSPCATGVGVAVLEPLDSRVGGVFTFMQVGNHMEVEATVQGLDPNGEHPFRLGDPRECDRALDLEPRPTGLVGEDILPILKADHRGFASVSFWTTLWTVDSGLRGVIGRTVVVHRSPTSARGKGGGIACASILVP